MKQRSQILEFSLAIILNFVPLILFWIDGTWRSSISDYAYSEYSYVFVFLITLSGSLFVFNGFGLQRHWYNIILGLGLFGVCLTPCRDNPTIHYVFASVFFVGSVLAIQLSSDRRYRLQKNIISVPIGLALVAHFLFGWYSLLVAEWISIVPIAVHFILKSINQDK